MKYLGMVRRRDNHLTMPDTFREVPQEDTYEAVQVGDSIVLLSPPLDRERLEQIQRLADRSIEEHRRSLEGLSR